MPVGHLKAVPEQSQFTQLISIYSTSMREGYGSVPGTCRYGTVLYWNMDASRLPVGSPRGTHSVIVHAAGASRRHTNCCRTLRRETRSTLLQSKMLIARAQPLRT